LPAKWNHSNIALTMDAAKLKRNGTSASHRNIWIYFAYVMQFDDYVDPLKAASISG
jgi:hypothetical protein